VICELLQANGVRHDSKTSSAHRLIGSSAHRLIGSSAHRLILAAALSMMAAVIPLHAAEAAPPESPAAVSDVQRLIMKQTGSAAHEMNGSATRLSGGHVIHQALAVDGRPLQTMTQERVDGFSVMAVLNDGQSSAQFDRVLPRGLRFATQGASKNLQVQVVDEKNIVVGAVADPWALDDSGRQLRTWYELSGDRLIQRVETTGARYPLVIDPKVTTGLWGVIPVYHAQFTWSETWKLKLALDKDSSSAPGLLCAYIPTTTGRVACGAVFLLVKSDVKNTVNAAIRAKQCYKLRVPATGGAISLPAYDSSYVRCTSANAMRRQ
jgi:hypothetical protein